MYIISQCSTYIKEVEVNNPNIQYMKMQPLKLLKDPSQQRQQNYIQVLSNE
jgi:hypothetical protein